MLTKMPQRNTWYERRGTTSAGCPSHKPIGALREKYSGQCSQIQTDFPVAANLHSANLEPFSPRPPICGR
jgi:hypothetical protein